MADLTEDVSPFKNAEVVVMRDDTKVRCTRDMYSVPVARTYADFGTEQGTFDRWQLSECYPPAYFLINNGSGACGWKTAEKVRSGEVLALDVRPADEFLSGHLPQARSLPLRELKKRLAELPKDITVVAYCRGPFCLMANEAVKFLRKNGYDAYRLTDGVAEWRARGLPIES